MVRTAPPDQLRRLRMRQGSSGPMPSSRCSSGLGMAASTVCSSSSTGKVFISQAVGVMAVKSCSRKSVARSPLTRRSSSCTGTRFSSCTITKRWIGRPGSIAKLSAISPSAASVSRLIGAAAMLVTAPLDVLGDVARRQQAAARRRLRARSCRPRGGATASRRRQARAGRGSPSSGSGRSAIPARSPRGPGRQGRTRRRRCGPGYAP